MKLSDIINSVHDYFTEKRFVIFTLSLVFILLLLVLFLSDGFTGGADSIQHYTFARNAFTHPEFLFNNWAKPVFTLLSAPFAVFGFKVMQFFNILVGVAAGFFSYLVAKELKMKQPILAIILCCFAPIFAYNIFSGLTEILFALVAIFSSYLLLKNRFILASIVISFLPFIRTEGVFLIPIYALFLINRRQYKSLPYLLIGTIAYSIVGSFFNGDLLWVFTQTPYSSKIGLYGTGSIFQYIKRSPGFFGIPNEIFYVTGFVAGLTLFMRDKREYSKEFFLVVLPFLTYFFAHSFMWWSGLGNSHGTTRYMAAIVPFMAVMSTRGLTLFSLLFEIIFKKSWVKTAALYVGIISVIHIPFVVQNYPIPYDSFTKAIKKASNWIKDNNLDKNKIYYNDATVYFMLGLDPMDNSKSQELIYNKEKSIEDIVESGSLVLYDERYSPYENVEFDILSNNQNFELVKVFQPDQNLKIMGKDYRIAIFRRL